MTTTCLSLIFKSKKMRLKYIGILFFAVLAVQIEAQDSATQIDKAVEIASEKDLNILMIFSGSDWCKPCIQLKEEVLESEEFKQYGKTRLVKLVLDFPYRKKYALSKLQKEHNEALAEKFNNDGSFPKVIILNDKVEELGKVQYVKNMSPSQFIMRLEDILNI